MYSADLDKYPMLRHLNARPELLGLQANLMPFVQFTSSQRSNMWSNNGPQSQIVKGAEMPNISSNYEKEFSRYTFNPTRIDQNGTTLACVPKYRTNIGSHQIKATPSWILIYLGDEDNLVHYVEVPTYMKGIDGFGWEMEVNHNLLTPNIGLKKDSYIAHSHAVQGSKYCLGINANVCFITMKETVEDAFCISESFADRMESTGIKTLIVDINKNDIPLNLYGDGDTYKFMPDILEQVNEDGILCALRKVHDSTVISDMNEEALTIPQYLHDEIFYVEVPRGSTVIDIDVVINYSKKVKTPAYIFDQITKYKEAHINFCKRISEIYKKECLSARKQASSEFNTLVTNCEMILSAYTKRAFNKVRVSAPKFTRKNEVIEFIQLVITYSYKNVVANGAKFSGREGGKGVVSAIIPDKDMPVNDFGVRADICIAPEALINRMNLGQVYEQFLNCLIYGVMQDIKQMDELEAFNYLIEFLNDVNPDYADTIKKIMTTDTKKRALIQEIIRTEQIIIVVPSFLDTLTPEWSIMMSEKYQIKSTPVEYNLYDGEGKFIRRVRTLKSFFIGKKYLYCLCKIPHARSCAMTYVNQYGIPIRIKAKRAKAGYPVGLTPIRVGEDETRNLVMTVGRGVASRILALYANSPEGTSKMVEELLTTDYPTRLSWVNMTDEQLANSNQTLKIYRHMMSTVGVDSVNAILDDNELNELTNIKKV